MGATALGGGSKDLTTFYFSAEETDSETWMEGPVAVVRGELGSVDAGGQRRGPRLCISSQLPGNANAAGPRATLGVAKMY